MPKKLTKKLTKKLPLKKRTVGPKPPVKMRNGGVMADPSQPAKVYGVCNAHRTLHVQFTTKEAAQACADENNEMAGKETYSMDRWSVVAAPNTFRYGEGGVADSW